VAQRHLAQLNDQQQRQGRQINEFQRVLSSMNDSN
jgi:hypothetical protein